MEKKLLQFSPKQWNQWSNQIEKTGLQNIPTVIQNKQWIAAGSLLFVYITLIVMEFSLQITAPKCSFLGNYPWTPHVRCLPLGISFTGSKVHASGELHSPSLGIKLHFAINGSRMALARSTPAGWDRKCRWACFFAMEFSCRTQEGSPSLSGKNTRHQISRAAVPKGNVRILQE